MKASTLNKRLKLFPQLRNHLTGLSNRGNITMGSLIEYDQIKDFDIIPYGPKTFDLELQESARKVEAVNTTLTDAVNIQVYFHAGEAEQPFLHVAAPIGLEPTWSVIKRINSRYTRVVTDMPEKTVRPVIDGVLVTRWLSGGKVRRLGTFHTLYLIGKRLPIRSS